MNLFIVRNSNTGKTLKHLDDGSILSFERKAQAKAARKKANGTDDDGNEVFSVGWTVSPGSDHRLAS